VKKFVSRAGEKLHFALSHFKISVKGKICADFGCSTGGFTNCLLANGAKKVYAVDTAYGELAWKLRNNSRVIVLERTNAMHVILPIKMDIITIDVGWTKQKNILPNALKNLKKDGIIISLIKPHYEAPKKYLRKGKLLTERIDEVLEGVKDDIKNAGAKIIAITDSPIVGEKRGNCEFLVWLKSERNVRV
jgi:23S rRNA (cytidine1920-2'-O)/16S rRNA (cytidine1409-2'-O)-methyltransferase